MRPAHVTLSHVIQPLHENYDIRNVYFIVIFIIVKLLMLVADIRISEARSIPYISRRHRRPRIYNKVYFPAPARFLLFYLKTCTNMI